MSFSSLCDHNSPSSVYSLQNPHSFLTVDRLSRRRRPQGDDRLHRHRRMEVGPDLCQRKIDPIHSFPNALNFIGTDGAIKIGQKELKRIAPALAENPLNLPNFGVPYSLNRQKRWHLTELSAAQLNTPEAQSNDLRVSIVWQKANPMRKGTVNGRFERFWPGPIGRFGEDKVAKFSTFDAEKEIHRLSKSTRGANSTVQLMQKGPKPKNRTCRRTQNALTGDGTTERWLDLFQPRDYSAVNPTPTSSAWSATEDACAPPVHNYYTFRTQSASRHQLNSGWQNKSMGKAMSKEEIREKGRWTKDWEGNAKWEAPSSRQIGLCLENGASPVVQKRRGVSWAKGGERFAFKADFGEYFQFLEKVDEDEKEEENEENEFEKDEFKMELDEQNGKEKTERTARRKPLEIGDYVIDSNRRGRKRNAKAKRKNWSCEVKEMHGQPMEILQEEEENEEANSAITALSCADKEEREGDKLCHLTPDQIGTVKANIAEFVPLDDDLNGFLPSCTSILQCRSDERMIRLANLFHSEHC